MQLLHITTVPMSLLFLRGQVGYMQRQGITVHAVSSPGAELDRFAREEGVSVTAVPMPRRITPLRDLVAVALLYRVLRTTRPTIVHAHTPKGGLLGMIAATLGRVPVRVYHMRGLPMLGSRGWTRHVLRWTEWLACRLAHRVLCVSHSVRAVVVEAGICEPAKIRVLLAGSGNGVDARGRFDPDRTCAERAAVRARLGIPAEARVIGFVGRVVRDKGIVELAEAWSYLRARHPHAWLLLIGPEETRDAVPAGVLDVLRRDPRVRFPGADWNPAPLYAAMDVVALPSYREGFPNVPLEAAAMRLPVVATRVPGCVDAVEEGVTGTLVPPRDARALAAALEMYLLQPALCDAHGRAGRARVLAEFTPERIWSALCAEYSELVRENVPTGQLAPQPERAA